MNSIVNMLKSWFLVNWKTTILGAVAAVELYQSNHDLKAAVTAFLVGLVASDGKTSHVLAKPPVATPPAAGFVNLRVLLLLSAVLGALLFAPRFTRADDVSYSSDTGKGFLSLKINDKWSVHLNASLAALEYDLTNKRFVGQAVIGGLWLFDYKGKVAFGPGLAFQTDGTAGQFTGDFAVASPKITIGPDQILRVAAILQAQSRSSKWSWGVAVGPLYQF